ncbi:MAG: hypothetical protein KAS01_00910 [Candidatus Pacebacteria bacterium]|nr:hypothetical protein [Candidatus Paceibacterota bacterium]
MRVNKLFNKLRKPSSDVIYTFIFNFSLLVITLWIGSYYIGSKLLEIDQKKTEQQNSIETKNEFIKKFTKLIQSRIYLSENYYLNIEVGESEDVLNRSWENYMDSVRFWNEENLLNPIFIKYYFGDEMQNEFYNEVQPKLVSLHNALLKMRNGEKIENIKEIVEETKHEAFVYSEKLMFNNN